MRNHSGIFKGRLVFLFVAFLAIPLFGWTTLPKPASSDALENSRAPGIVVQQSNSAQAPSIGNVETGQKLFMGNLHFRNGGPPCMGCHNIGSNGLLGGGAMGPDLTNVSTRRSQEEVASILSTSGPTISRVMQPIFTEHPLTESEQADLIAFLNASVGEPESNKEVTVIGISLAGFVAAVALLGFVYRDRLRGVRKPLLKKAQLQNR